MEITIVSKQLEVTPSLREYVEKKLQKLNRFFDHIQDIRVTESIVKDQHIIEVTIKAGHSLIRAEERTNDMYTSIDKVVDKLEVQLKKYKGRFITNKREAFKGEKPSEAILLQELAEEERALLDDIPKIVRTKSLSLKPMDVEDAIIEMDLLGHNFYIFRDINENAVSVIYKRHDGNIGLITTSGE